MANYNDPPQPLGGFATTIIVFLVLIATFSLFNLIGDLAYIGVLGEFGNGEASASDVEDVQIALGALSIFGFIFACLAAGFFIAWMYRAYRNLERMSVAGMRYESGWAIGAWFIPFFNLLRPKQIIDDIWRAGEAGVEVRDDSWRRRQVPMLLHWWWGIWVASFIVAVAVGILSFDPEATAIGVEDVDNVRTTTSVALISVACQMIAAVLGCLVVRRITKRGDALRTAVFGAAQTEAAEAQAAYAQSTPAPLPPASPPPGAAPYAAPPTAPLASPIPPGPAPPAPPPEAAPPLTADADGKMTCDICGWRFNDEPSARKHVETHHPGAG
ncbi:MAG: DUF4328 domain-containing protein [Solirubrobacterales bacterium]